MSYTIEKLPDERIIINTLNEDYTFGHDSAPNVDELIALLDAQPVPTYLLIDLTAASVNFSDILQAIALVTKQYQLLKHRNVCESVVIANKPFLKSAAEGLRNPLFGNVKIRVFDSIAAALAYVREQMTAGA
ncbi:MAG: hypothetical protein U0694_08665 [Anaerolineae bacterium]